MEVAEHLLLELLLGSTDVTREVVSWRGSSRNMLSLLLGPQKSEVISLLAKGDLQVPEGGQHRMFRPLWKGKNTKALYSPQEVDTQS